VSFCSPSVSIQLNELFHSRLPKVVQSNITRCPQQACFAAEYKNRFYASAIWTTPVARMLNGRNMLELRRLAIADNAPKNTATRMLKIMRLEIRKKFPTVKTLISYQDTEVHTGTIYKAAGWQAVCSSKPSVSGWNTRKRNKMQTTAEKIRWEYEL